MINLDLLLADPSKVERLTSAEIRGLLVRMSSLLAALAARFTRDEAPPVRSGVEGDDGRLCTIPEVAKQLAVPESRAYDLARRGELPAVKIGRYVRVPAASLQAWLEERKLDLRVDR